MTESTQRAVGEKLVFETTEYPPQKNMAKEWEIKRPGHADFWFQNSSQSEVRMALQSKSCKQSETTRNETLVHHKHSTKSTPALANVLLWHSFS